MEVRTLNSKRGFSLMEMLIASSIGVLATFVMANTTILAAKTFKKVSDVSSGEAVGRRTFNLFTADVQATSVSLAKFPGWASSPWYTAQEDKCVILQQPVFNADKTVDPEKFTVIVYKLETPASAADGPFVLRRWVCPLTITASTKSASSGGSGTIVCKNIKSVNWNQMTNQTFWGDQNTTTYNILSTPLSDTPEVKLQALVGGIDRLNDGKATMAGTAITMYKPLVWGVALDVTYHTDPSLSVDTNGSNGATAMFARFVFQPNWTDSAGNTKTRDVTLSALPQFENKVD